MSVQAIVWALEEAPLSKASHLGTLLALANEADSEGKGAFPSQRTMSWQTRKSDRAVRDDLRQMVKDGVIKPGDQDRAAYIPADRRPVVYDLCIERTRDMSKRPNSRPVSGWDGKHRTTDDVDRTDEPGGSTPPPDAEPQVETPGSTLPGGSTASDRAEAQRQTGRKHTADDPGINPKNNTHTPGTTETDSNIELKTATGVCFDPDKKLTPEQSEARSQALKDVLALNLVTRAPASTQNHDDELKRMVIAQAGSCIDVGVTFEEIDIALSAAINAETTHPLSHGLKALTKLINKHLGTEDPLPGGTQDTHEAEYDSWTDNDGQPWPRLRPDQRECGGRQCFDQGRQRYVSIDHPIRGAFSCPTCKNAYKKGDATA